MTMKEVKVSTQEELDAALAAGNYPILTAYQLYEIFGKARGAHLDEYVREMGTYDEDTRVGEDAILAGLRAVAAAAFEAGRAEASDRGSAQSVHRQDGCGRAGLALLCSDNKEEEEDQ